MIEQYPVVTLDSDAFESSRLIAEQRLPGLVVTDNAGHPRYVLGSSEVVRFILPTYVRDDPSLAGVLDEQFADHAADNLSGIPVRDVLPPESEELAVVEADGTVLEVAAAMGRTHRPLVVVLQDGEMIGVVTASRLLELALAGERGNS